jgi:hypothetical protein
MLRPLFLILLLTTLAWWLHGEQQSGRFRQVDETFLDFLLANTRDELKPDLTKASDVVFITLREEDKAEYEAWPPLPIDYQMILKALAASEPAMLAITQPLQWLEPKPPFLDQFAESMLALPSVVLSADAAVEGAADGAVLAFAKDKLPQITRVQGAADLLPVVVNVPAKPEPALLRQADVGLSVPGKSAIALRVGERVVPSVDLQILIHATRTPFSRVRLNVGPGAGLHLGDEIFVPLSREVGLLAGSTAVSELNAVDLITASVTGEDVEVAKILGKNKFLVIGLGDEATRQRVQSLTAALSLPRLRVLSFVEQVAAWGVAGLLALSLLWLPRKKAILRALIYLFLALTGSYLAFQNGRLWCPPAIPAALLIAGGIFARLFGRAAQPGLDSAPATN